MSYIPFPCPHCEYTVGIDTEAVSFEITDTRVIARAHWNKCDECGCLFDCEISYERVPALDAADVIGGGSR